MGFDTVYAVQGEGVILVDGGDPHMLARLQKGLATASIKPEEIQLILLTHGHWDHIGSTRDIKSWTGARVMLHQQDMHFLDEPYPSQPPGFTTWGKVIIAVLKLYSRFVRIPRFDVDIVLGDEEVSLREFGIPGKVIYTPGHSWGSVSVLLETGEAFVGDLAMNMIPMRFKPGLAIFGDDIQIIKKSCRDLLDSGAKMIYPAHGKPFPAEILAQALA